MSSLNEDIEDLEQRIRYMRDLTIEVATMEIAIAKRCREINAKARACYSDGAACEISAQLQRLLKALPRFA